MRFLLLLFIGLLFFQKDIQSEVNTRGEFEQILEEAKKQYNDGEYEETIQQLERAMTYVSEIEKSDQVEAYKYLGFSYVAFGNIDAAKLAFKRVLELHPTLELDPNLVSPKIIKVFEKTKAEIPEPTKPKELEREEKLEKIKELPKVEESPILRKKTVMGAFLRSAVIPGWGQLYKEQRTKGYLIMGLETIAVGGLIWAHLSYRNAHDEYINAQKLGEIQSAYDRYDSMYKLRDAMLGVTVTIWGYNMLDAFLGLKFIIR